MRKSFQRGFTLVEVLVAAGILAIGSAGLLATTWAMVGFARGEAERMMADNLAHDVMRAVYCQKFDDIQKISKITFNTDTALPQIVSKDIFGRTQSPVCSLWRDKKSSHKPYCTVSVSEKAATETAPASKTITVTVYWYVGNEKQKYAPTPQIRYPFGDET